MSKGQNEKKWKFDKCGDYYTDLAMKESTNNPSSISDLRYIGLYQMGEMALVDTGYYKKTLKPKNPSEKLYNHDWTGTWTGKHGINSRDDFLANRTVQDIAIREYHKIVWEKYLSWFQEYEGQTLGGVELTKSGMISCGHLVGHREMKKFINSRGNINKDDANGTTCADYLKGFMGYVVDYSIDKYIKKLHPTEPEKPAPVQQAPNIPTPSQSKEFENALKCIDLYRKCRELGKELDDRLRNPFKQDGIPKRPAQKISQESNMCNAELSSTRCNLRPESAYMSIVNRYNQGGKGNGR